LVKAPVSRGVASVIGASRLGLVLVPGGAIALGLAGLPLTGGALTKLAAKVPFGYGLAGVLATCSAAGTALLMLHFLERVASTANQKTAKVPSIVLVIGWLAMALLCIAVPWAAYPLAGLESFSDALAPAIIWKTLWPVIVGVGLFLVCALAPRPKIPSATLPRLASQSCALPTWGLVIAKLDGILRLWTAACLMLVHCHSLSLRWRLEAEARHVVSHESAILLQRRILP
jgi:hypothetical protein